MVKCMTGRREARAPGPRQGDRRTTLLIYAVIAGLSLLALWPLIESERLTSRGEEAAKRGDFQTAFEAWQPLAERGDADAQFRLGVLFDRGLGTREDPFAAVEWYRRAAEQGHAGGQYFLAQAYEEGRGVPQDLTLAYAWYNLAAAQGDEDAVRLRDDARSRMTLEQIAEAQELSRTLWERIEVNSQ